MSSIAAVPLRFLPPANTREYEKTARSASGECDTFITAVAGDTQQMRE